VGWLGRSIGGFGAQAGEGHDIALDWRAREQDMRMKAAKQKLDELLLPLQIQEIQARIRQMGSPQTRTIGLPGGGTGLFSISPSGDASDVRTLVPGEEPPLKQRYESEKDPEKKKQLLAEMTQESEATSGARRNPIQKVQQELADALNSGDNVTAAKKLDELKTIVSGSKAPSAPTMTGLWWAKQHGDKDAAATLADIEAKDTRLLMARGEGFARARAQYNFQPFMNDQGEIVAMNGVDAKRLVDSGQTLTPVSRIAAKDANAFQQFSGEAARSIPDVRRWAKAYDNPEDRAIYAGIMAKAGPMPPGGEVSWLRTILAQASTANLSPEGKQLNQAVAGLNETVGRLRSILGLPATESAMALTLGIVPGPSTPNSAYVLGYDQNGQHMPGQLDRLEAMASIATGVPAMRGVFPKTPNAPPPGSKVISLDDFLKGKTQ
jgi:hypothetical protein